MRVKTCFLLLTSFLIIMLSAWFLVRPAVGEEQYRNVIFILADTGNKSFQAWNDEFLKARDYYHDKIPSAFYDARLENFVYVLDLDAYTRKERDSVRLAQNILGLTEGEPFIGIIKIPWARTAEGWGPGDMKKAKINIQLPFDRSAYQIAGGKVQKVDPKILEEITREDYRWFLREMMKPEG